MTVWDTPQNAIQRALELMRRERVRQQNNMAQRQAFAQNTMQGFANRPDVAAHRLATEAEFAQKGYLGETAPGHLQPGPPQYAQHQGLLGGAIRNLTTPVIGGDPTGLSSPVGFLTGAVSAGLAPLSASAFGLAGGTAGAIGGGEAAQRFGIPRPIGQLAGGLAGGIGAGALGPIITQRAGQAVERAGGLPALISQEAGGSQFAPGPYSRALRTLAQREAGRTIATTPEQAPIEQAVQQHMANTGKTANDLLGEFATTRAVPPELGQAAAAGGGGDAFETGRQTLIDSFKTQRRNIRETAAVRSQQQGQRLVASEDAYSQAIAQGKTPREAFAIKRAAQSGPLAEVAGAAPKLAPEQESAIIERIRNTDFGRGMGADFERDRAMGALFALSTGKPIQENEVATLERALGPDFGTALRQAAVKSPQGMSLPYELAMTPKAILSAFDMSYPLRQGAMLGPGHPVEFGKAFMPMVRAMGSEEGATQVYRSLADDATLVTKVDGSTVTMGRAMEDTRLITSSEQQIQGKFAESLPLIGRAVRGSNRAFSAFGNKFRGDVFRTIVGKWQGQGVPITDERLQNLSNMLNRFSGRGTLSTAADSRLGQIANATWWAPATRLAPPEAVAQLFNYKDPIVAKEAWRNMVAFLGTGMSLMGAAKVGGLAVGVDPRDTDFGKIVIGKTHVNIWGPAQPLARTLARIMTAQRIDIRTGNPVPAGRLDEAWRYFRSGLAPEWSAIYDTLSGQNILGQPIKPDLATLKRELPNRILPLAMQDFYDAIREEGPLAGAAVAPATFFGESVSTYGPNFNPKYPPEFDKLPEQQQVELDHFLARVDEARSKLPSDGRPPVEQSIVNLGTQEKRDGDFIGWALRLHKSVEASTAAPAAPAPAKKSEQRSPVGPRIGGR